MRFLHCLKRVAICQWLGRPMPGIGSSLVTPQLLFCHCSVHWTRWVGGLVGGLGSGVPPIWKCCLFPGGGVDFACDVGRCVPWPAAQRGSAASHAPSSMTPLGIALGCLASWGQRSPPRTKGGMGGGGWVANLVYPSAVGPLSAEACPTLETPFLPRCPKELKPCAGSPPSDGQPASNPEGGPSAAAGFCTALSAGTFIYVASAEVWGMPDGPIKSHAGWDFVIGWDAPF